MTSEQRSAGAQSQRGGDVVTEGGHAEKLQPFSAAFFGWVVVGDQNDAFAAAKRLQKFQCRATLGNDSRAGTTAKTGDKRFDRLVTARLGDDAQGQSAGGSMQQEQFPVAIVRGDDNGSSSCGQSLAEMTQAVGVHFHQRGELRVRQARRPEEGEKSGGEVLHRMTGDTRFVPWRFAVTKREIKIGQ